MSNISGLTTTDLSGAAERDLYGQCIVRGITHAFFWLSFALLISSGSILVLVNGAFRSSNNPVLAAALIGGATLGMVVGGRWRELHRVNWLDAIFFAFLAVLVCSTAINGLPDARALVLFVLAPAAYPACRFAPHQCGVVTFSEATAAVVMPGTIAGAVSDGAAFVRWWRCEIRSRVPELCGRDLHDSWSSDPGQLLFLFLGYASRLFDQEASL
jgi:hypothetical protein